MKKSTQLEEDLLKLVIANQDRVSTDFFVFNIPAITITLKDIYIRATRIPKFQKPHYEYSWDINNIKVIFKNKSIKKQLSLIAENIQ